VSKMNKAATCFRKAAEELLNNYKRTVENRKSLYGIYWTEQDLVVDLASRIKNLLKDEPCIRVHLNVCINKEFDYIAKKGSEWLKNRPRRFVDILILDENKKEGDGGPFSLVAEVKFSYRDTGQSIDKQVTKQIEGDIERLKDLKSLCREVFFFYLDEYNKDENRKKVNQLIKTKCGQTVQFYHEWKAVDCDEYGRQK